MSVPNKMLNLVCLKDIKHVVIFSSSSEVDGRFSTSVVGGLLGYAIKKIDELIAVITALSTIFLFEYHRVHDTLTICLNQNIM